MNISFISGLVVGGLASGMGKYLLGGVTQNRKKTELVERKKNDLNMLFEQHPDFMAQIKQDVKAPQYEHIREFFVVDKHVLMSSTTPRLRYDLVEDILPALDKLEALGFIERQPNDALLYRMHDDLIVQLHAA